MRDEDDAPIQLFLRKVFLGHAFFLDLGKQKVSNLLEQRSEAGLLELREFKVLCLEFTVLRRKLKQVQQELKLKTGHISSHSHMAEMTLVGSCTSTWAARPLKQRISSNLPARHRLRSPQSLSIIFTLEGDFPSLIGDDPRSRRRKEDKKGYQDFSAAEREREERREEKRREEKRREEREREALQHRCLHARARQT